jgi:hypothetical protein
MVSLADRADLERLDRETLIARAEQAGVSRASILTRPELIDELLVRSASVSDPRITRARGFFGKARDLLARVVERGLHLPDAAERLRHLSVPAAPRRSVPPAAVPTVTLAEIYATQGHRGRAIETLKRVLEREPDHGAARALLMRLSSEASERIATGLPDPPATGDPPSGGAVTSDRPADVVSPDVVPSKVAAPDGVESAEADSSDGSTEPDGFLDDDALPTRYDVDECVALPVDPTTLFAYWEIRESTLAHHRNKHPNGSPALRLLVITPSWEGPRTTTTDLDVRESLGDEFLRDLPPGAIARVAVGWKYGEVFLPIAHGPALETPQASPSERLADEWFAWSPAGMKRVEDPRRLAVLPPKVTEGAEDGRAHGATRTSHDGRDAGAWVDSRPTALFEGQPAPQGSSERVYA